MYHEGQGAVIQDYAEAFRLYKEAAEQGNSDAQYAMGNAYVIGHLINANFAEARRWYNLAAGQGHAEAQKGLGRMHALGIGTKTNAAKALMWYLLAELGEKDRATPTVVEFPNQFIANTVDKFAPSVVTLDSKQFEYSLTLQERLEGERLARECQARKFKNCD